ncbi:MAG: terminase family protein [Puniceicoccales bacterium]|jgi:phage FluMu gp28-like protein|nr:terminase family protein [Puniceicoccales bacterium]
MRDGNRSFFLPYQASWILDASPLKILEKSRQIGMTLATAYGAVRRHASKVNHWDTWAASRDELQAKLFVADCKKFAQMLAPACNFFGNAVVCDEKIDTFVSLRFSDGRAINSLPSSVNSQAGKRGSRILDEFALHGDQKNLYATALPGITWGGQLEILSTHRGSNNFFNKLICEVRDGGNPKKFSYHRVTLQDALEQGFLDKLRAKLAEWDERGQMSDGEYFDSVKNGCPDEESFLQEYMCVPADDRSSFITSDMVAHCEYGSPDSGEIFTEDGECGSSAVRDDLSGIAGRKAVVEEKPLHNANWQWGNFSSQTGECFLGIDIGRSHDLTVFWLLEKRGEMLLTRSVLCMKDAPFSSQESELRKFFTLAHLGRVCIDQSGIGRQFFERAAERFGKYRVEGIAFTNATKELLAYQLREVFENEVLRIPSDDFIRADLRSIKRETTLAGNVRFAGDRGKNGHADRFWALALAVHAACSVGQTATVHFEKIEQAAAGRKRFL